jgi:hypothetical protein
MNRSSVSPKTILTVAFVALVVWALYASIEFYDETVTSSWSGDATRNPYLAAQQFMTRSEIDIVDADSLVKLDRLEGVGTLFISEANQVRSPRQLKQVLSWLESGGHIIYTASSVAHDDDLLLKEFDVEVDWREADDEGEDIEEKPLSETFREYNRQIEQGKTREEATESINDKEEALTLVEFGDDIGDLEIEFDDSKVLTHPYISGTGYDTDKLQPTSWSYSDAGIHLMQFDVGDGLLTIISDPKIWTSYYIENHDHAFLLWILSSSDGSFAVLRPVLQDSIWLLIGRYGFEALIAGAILIALWIWHMGYRFGRLQPQDQSRTRALGEHFSSISHYLWHRKHAEHLISPLRQRVMRRASLTLGEFSIVDQARQYELIAERVDITVDAVVRAMSETQFSEITFVQRVKLLKRIEQLL